MYAPFLSKYYAFTIDTSLHFEIPHRLAPIGLRKKTGGEYQKKFMKC